MQDKELSPLVTPQVETKVVDQSEFTQDGFAFSPITSDIQTRETRLYCQVDRNSAPQAFSGLLKVPLDNYTTNSSYMIMSDGGIKIPKDGRYLIIGDINFVSVTAAVFNVEFYVAIYINGVQKAIQGDMTFLQGSCSFKRQAAKEFQLYKGDEVHLYAYSSDGASIGYNAAATFLQVLQAMKIL